MIKTTLLQNGEYAGICTLEITSIPHISILESEYSNKTKEEILFKYKVDMQALISELYQNYKLNDNNDISYELLWVTTPVENQTFKAKIKLFINVRVVNKSNDALKASIQSSIQLIGINEKSSASQLFRAKSVLAKRVKEWITHNG